MRPIDAEWLRRNLGKVFRNECDQYYGMMQLIDEAPTLTPPNEPLTLDELREMDGQPVWVKCLKPDKYTYPPVGWRILETAITGNFGVWNGDCVLIERDYGTDWLAYRRPPDGEEVEKVWRGEWKCYGDCGITECSACGWNIEEYVGDYNFCPVCGAPMTDEALQMVMERMEALHETVE